MKTFLNRAAFFLFLTSARLLLAATDDHWDDQFGAPGVDAGTVLCVATNGTDVYVGGQFTSAGSVISPGIARWDGTNWFALGGGLGNSTAPSALAVAAHGRDIYVAGYFTNAGSVAAKGVARWDGTNWFALGGGVNSTLAYSLQFMGNNLYVGGNFTAAGGVAATNIARWDGTNWFAVGTGLNDNTNGLFAAVTSLAADTNGNLYAAGLFRNAGTSPMNNIARWDGTNWNSLAGGLAVGPSPTVNQIIWRGGILYAAGSFRQAGGGVNATNLAKWDGSAWTAMGGGPSGTNYGIAFVGTNFYTTGNFTNIAGVRAMYAAHWNGSAWEALAAGTAGELSTSASCAGADGNYFYAGGSFIRAGSAGILGIARWDGSQWTGLNGPRTHGGWLTVNRLLVLGGSNIYIGGSGLQLAGGVAANRIAHWNGSQWDNVAGGVTGSVGGSSVGVNSIIENSGLVYVGGSFTNAGGVAARNIAVWDGANWSPMASGFNSNVNALVFYQGTLFAGGAFTKRGDGSAALHGIAQWDGSDWQDVPLIESWRVNNVISALASDGNNLYAGGNFNFGWGYSPTYPVGDNIDNIGRWDGSFWHSMGAGLTNTINALAFYNGELYAGGSFTNASIKRIAKWNGSAWTSPGAGFTNGSVFALAANANALYAGGNFTNSGGSNLWRIAKWDGSAWSPLGSGVTNSFVANSGTVQALALDGDDVYLVGAFTRAGGKMSMAIARWNETVSFVPPIIRLLNQRWESGLYRFDIGGLFSGNFSVLASSNLVNWDSIYSGSVPNTNFSDPDSPIFPNRFYRVSYP